MGEAPDYDSEKEGKCFSGGTGEELDRLLGQAGISRERECRITYTCNYRPADNNFQYLGESKELKDGIADVLNFIREHKPKIVVILGEKPLNYFLGRKGIEKWRGSFIEKDGQLYYCTYNPYYITRNRSEYPIACFDFQRLKSALDFGYKFPEHDFVIDPRGMDLLEAVKEIKAAKKITIDIETPKKNPFHLLCVGFAVSSKRAFCIVNHSFIGMGTEFESAIRSILEDADPEQIQVYHNGYAFDVPVFNKLSIEARIDRDTIIAAHSIRPEFRLSLAFLTSIYTKEPYYKSMISDSEDPDTKGWSDKVPKEVLYDYNCRDVITTWEIDEKQQAELEEDPYNKETFKHEMELIPITTHIGSTGLLIDLARREHLLRHVNVDIAKRQQLLNAIAGKHVNPNGRIVLHNLLYNEFKLPVRKNRKGETTADEDAIVSLISVAKIKADETKTPSIRFEWEKKWAALKLILILRGLLKLKSSYLEFDLSEDGRVRSLYKITGTETGRLSCSKYIDKTGLNAQTFPRESLEVAG